MIVIEVEDLKKQFKVDVHKNWIKNILHHETIDVEVVKGVSFKIQKGESVAFLGQNGAGKTTTTKMMTGLIHPTSGNINVLGFLPLERKKEFLMRIGLVMGNKAGLNWDLTARQSFDLYKKIYKIDQKLFEERLEKLSKLLEVDTLLYKQVRKLSLGERMKLELIGAIIHNPEILFLDEPTIGLDIIAKQNIRKFLREIQKEYGITLVLTSHDMDDIETVCDRVIIINKGTIVYDDSMVSLKNMYSKERYVKFLFSESSIKDQKYLDISNKYGKIFESGKESFTVNVPPQNISDLIADITKQYSIEDIEINSIPLEEMVKEIFEKK